MHNLSLSEVSAALRAKKFSGPELMTNTLKRLNSIGRNLNLIVDMNEEDALRQAKQADPGKSRHPLNGIPLAHKDMFYRTGRISACGSKILKTVKATSTATVLKRLDRAGAIDTARLSMVEFALGVTGHNDVAKTAHNPWHKDHIPGGSSSGSAAAVSARVIYAALGSDTGGSIRIPACCTGVVGMKPTWGRVSRFAAMPLSASLDTIGPLTRTVRDNALVFETIAGADDNDPTSSRTPVPDCLSSLENGVRGLKIGVPESYFLHGLDREIENMIAHTLQIYQRLGAEIIHVEMPPDMAKTNALNSLIIATEGAALHAKWMKTRGNDYGPQTFARLLTGTLTPATRYLEALDLRHGILAQFADNVFSRVDAMIAPVLKTPTPTLKDTDFGDKPGFSDLVRDLGFATRPFNYLGLPALSMPAGLTENGLPTGFQLIGRPFNEDMLYRMGRAYERETGYCDMDPG